MNNKPVAWGMTWKDGEIYDVISPAQHAKEEGDYTVPLYTHQYERPHNTVLVPCDKLAEMQAEIEALKAIVERLTADWTDGFRNYEYNSSPEENKLRDDVFAILRKASEKCLTFYAE